MKPKVFSGFAVKDLAKAKDFYANTLGLDAKTGEMGMLEINLGDGHSVMVYDKSDLKPANYTVLNIVVGDIDMAVDELAKKGVKFEKYEGFNQDDKRIARADKENLSPA